MLKIQKFLEDSLWELLKRKAVILGCKCVIFPKKFPCANYQIIFVGFMKSKEIVHLKVSRL